MYILLNRKSFKNTYLGVYTLHVKLKVTGIFMLTR